MAINLDNYSESKSSSKGQNDSEEGMIFALHTTGLDFDIWNPIRSPEPIRSNS